MANSAADRARRLLRLTPRSRLVLDAVLVLLLLALDARDLWFKLRWLGPRDSYSFVSVTHHEMQETPLVPTRNLTIAGQRHQRASGWSSFLQRCDALYPLTDRDDPFAFSHTLGKGCELGLPENSHRAPELVMSSSARVDAVAWAACALLTPARRPAVCHSPMVRLFEERTNSDGAPSLLSVAQHGTAAPTLLDAARVPPQNLTVAPGGAAEAELTELLSVISTSAPLAAVVCVEAFEPRGPGRYTAALFGCGSPSYFRSAFAGRAAAALPLLLQDKARLATDALHTLGMSLVARENARSVFSVRHHARDALALRHKALLNVSCFGALFALLLAADALLLALSAASALQAARAVGRDSAHRYKLGTLSAPLVRSAPVAALLALARLLAWPAVLPAAALARAGAGSLEAGGAHAALSLARVWDLALVLVNALWDLAAALDEPRALRVARATHVRVREVAVVALAALAWRRGAVLAALGAKRRLEGQRLRDAGAFRGLAGLATAFPPALDFVQTTPAPALRTLYAPLAEVLALSVAGVAAIALLRGWLLARSASGGGGSEHRAGPIVGKRKRLSKFAVLPDASGDAGEEAADAPLLRAADATTDESRAVQFAFATAGPKEDDDGASALRLPIEQLLDEPVRARSLVRGAFVMEKRVGRGVSVHPTLLLEHGVALHDGGETMRTRCGFFGVVRPFLSARAHAPGLSADTAMLKKASGVGDGGDDGFEQVPLR